jgi:hypothetical protein
MVLPLVLPISPSPFNSEKTMLTFLVGGERHVVAFSSAMSRSSALLAVGGAKSMAATEVREVVELQGLNVEG